MRWSTICVVLFFLGLGKTFAQTMGSPTAETACTLADGKQMSLRYTEIPGAGKQDLPMGKVWTPGNASMDLFTQADVLTGKTEIPVGAYSTYIIPDKRSWTFIINKNVAADGKYDEQRDLVRIPMQIGHLGTKVNFEATFVHIAPKQCNIRIYYGKVGSWVEFKEK